MRLSADISVTINQPPAIFFTGPIHINSLTTKEEHSQSSVHKASIVVPPNAIDGEKVTVQMGATTVDHLIYLKIVS